MSPPAGMRLTSEQAVPRPSSRRARGGGRSVVQYNNRRASKWWGHNVKFIICEVHAGVGELLLGLLAEGSLLRRRENVTVRQLSLRRSGTLWSITGPMEVSVGFAEPVPGWRCMAPSQIRSAGPATIEAVGMSRHISDNPAPQGSSVHSDAFRSRDCSQPLEPPVAAAHKARGGRARCLPRTSNLESWAEFVSEGSRTVRLWS